MMPICLFASSNIYGAASGSSATPPNVLIILMDTMRQDGLSCYGAPGTTPTLDAIAAEGLRYTHFYVTGSWTLPSHASLFTGQPTIVHQIDAHTRRSGDAAPGEKGDVMPAVRLPGRMETLTSVLTKAGYRTVGICHNYHVSSETTLDYGFEQYYEGQDIRDLLAGPAKDAPGGARQNRVVNYWLDTQWDEGKPFLMFVNYLEPHQPYNPPEPYRSRYVKEPYDERLPLLNWKNSMEAVDSDWWDDDNFRIMKLLYYAEAAQLDDILKDLFEGLRQRELLDDMLLIITSDHGDCIGEHRRLAHGSCVWDAQLKVPLIIRYPLFVTDPGVVEQGAQISDAMPTILDLVGLHEEREHLGLPGKNLITELPQQKGPRAVFLESYGGRKAADEDSIPEATMQLKAIVKGNYKYIWSKRERDVGLYQPYSDPAEEDNLIDTKPEIAAALKDELRQWVESHGYELR